MKTGRPTQPTRSTIQLRCEEAERAAFEERAKSLHLTISEWLRLLARRDAGLWVPDGPPLTPTEPSQDP